ncbi:MAG: glycosyltransferase [Gaiellaceae bacterium]
MRIAIVCRNHANSLDAIRDNAVHKAAALRALGLQVDLCFVGADGLWRSDPNAPGVQRLDLCLADHDAVILEYNPFLYGPRGFAPRLPVALWRIRLRRDRPRIALALHEFYVEATSLRWAAMSLWQRVQLYGVLAATDVVFTAVWRWRRKVTFPCKRRAVVHVPSGSNLPDMRAERERSRGHLGVAAEAFVIATFGTDHPSHLVDFAQGAIAAIALGGRQVIYLALGAGARVPAGLPPSIVLHRPGLLPAEELAALLASADLFLAPFDDGVSTRRTTLVAALQHGLPVLGTDGPSTDDLLRRSEGLWLVPVDRRDLFAAAALELSRSSASRQRLAEAGRYLFQTEFDWPILARRIAAAFERDR